MKRARHGGASALSSMGLLGALALGLAGCGESADALGGSGDASVATDASSEAPVPAFSLVDENPTSPRAGEPVSPRDYLQRVSGWYFTHAG